MSQDVYRCARCGATTPETARFCSRCGAHLHAPSWLVSLLRILLGLALGVVALLAGGLGACFVIFSSSDLQSGGVGRLVIGLGLCALAAAGLAGMARLLR